MKQIRRKATPEFSSIMAMDNRYFERNTFVSNYRNMLDNCHVGDYIEADSMQQGGTVDGIIRNKDGVPVCYKIRYGEYNSIDYLAADRITLWEPSGKYPVPATNEEYIETAWDIE